ncbi:TniQ family protein [Bacillus sp. ISL-37]|uniref:TniQ family protein n=1 Tax=Bacillus sp. ISL-37 TaxID=2819123 RepID=UPI001BEA03B0|nr:TniQ family protein [Bacillus sp. ISL-37]MBT2685309.1 TniQ family protein [Bacillus sp. ISL-37]
MNKFTSNHISARSTLFNIEPQGMNSPLVESLTSYISRISDYHCLSTGVFISKLLAPYLKKHYISAIATRGGNGFYDCTNGINGIGSLASDFVNVIELLTYRSDISKTTLLPWTGILPTRGLLESKKKWCPFCYQEAINNTSIIYEPLIWFLKESKYCLIHKTFLVSKCIKCSKEMNILSRNSKPGFCDNCDCWLGSNKENLNNKIPHLGETLHIEDRIGEMLKTSSGSEKVNINKTQICKSLNYYLDELFEGNIKDFAETLGIPSTTFRYWVRGINLPPLYSLIRICNVLEISIWEFLQSKQIPIAKSSMSKLPANKIKDRKKYDYGQIKNILLDEINSSEKNSLTKIAEKIDCDRKLLYQKFPNESKKIVENYKSKLDLKKTERQKAFHQQLIEVINVLKERNVYPSRRNVEKELRGNFLLKESYFREVWKDIKKNM